MIDRSFPSSRRIPTTLHPDQLALLGDLPTEQFHGRKALDADDHSALPYQLQEPRSYLAPKASQEDPLHTAKREATHLEQSVAQLTQQREALLQKLVPKQAFLQQIVEQLSSLHAGVQLVQEGADFGLDVIAREAERITQKRISSPDSPFTPAPKGDEQQEEYVQQAYQALLHQGSAEEQRHAKRMMRQYEEKRDRVKSLKAQADALERAIAPDEASLRSVEASLQAQDWRLHRLIRSIREAEAVRRARGREMAEYRARLEQRPPQERAWFAKLEQAHAALRSAQSAEYLQPDLQRVFTEAARAYKQNPSMVMHKLRAYLSPDLFIRELELQMEAYLRRVERRAME